jgi:hypothetical protein
MDPNYALRVRKYLNKLLDARFIYPIESTQWLSPLVIVLKKMGKLHTCVDYQKLHAKTKKDPFMLPFLDLVSNLVARHEMYSFMDGYNGYNQVKMVEENKENIAFISKWVHMHITLCHLGYAMLLPLFKK